VNEIQNLGWSRVKHWADEELKSLRSKLEAPVRSHEETQVIRGEIRALKRLIDLPVELAAQRPQIAPPGWPGGDAA
jgi:hypothetical protein